MSSFTLLYLQEEVTLILVLCIGVVFAQVHTASLMRQTEQISQRDGQTWVGTQEPKHGPKWPKINGYMSHYVEEENKDLKQNVCDDCDHCHYNIVQS